MSFRITTLWAWTQVDPDDDEEGIIAYFDPESRLQMPLIASDRVRLDTFRPFVERVVSVTGRTATLRQFGDATELDRVDP